MRVTRALNGSYLLAFVGFVVGVGFMAAQFSSGSMGNWLTFEPRRLRVYASKLGAVGLGLIPVTVALTLAAAVGGAAIGALLRHTAAVLGIAIGYLVVVEGIFSRELQGLQPWLLQINFSGWVKHGTTYQAKSCTTDHQGQYACEQIEKILTFGTALCGVTASGERASPAYP